MKSLFYVMAGVTLCVLLAFVGMFLPQIAALSYLTVSLACVTGLLCIGGILRYMMGMNS